MSKQTSLFDFGVKKSGNVSAEEEQNDGSDGDSE